MILLYAQNNTEGEFLSRERGIWFQFSLLVRHEIRILNLINTVRELTGRNTNKYVKSLSRKYLPPFTINIVKIMYLWITKPSLADRCPWKAYLADSCPWSKLIHIVSGYFLFIPFPFSLIFSVFFIELFFLIDFLSNFLSVRDAPESRRWEWRLRFEYKSSVWHDYVAKCYLL